MATKYLVEQFKEIGLEPLFDGKFAQTIPGPDTEDGKPTYVGQNLGAWLPGSDPALKDEIVILSAHYDHLGKVGDKIFPGADDNASSVAMMLEVARQIKRDKTAPRRSIAFLAFDLEENLLWGSTWFAAHMPWKMEQIKLFITADLLGRPLGDLPLPVVFVMGAEHSTGLRSLVEATPRPKGIEPAFLGIDLVGNRSDYVSFRDARTPFLFFSSGQHPDYHTPNDLPERIDYDRLAQISTLILGVCRQVAQADSTPQWTRQPERSLDEIRALNRITTLLLKLDDEHAAGREKLTTTQRSVAVNLHNLTAKILKRGQLLSSDRLWLIPSAQAMLLTVF